MAGKFVLILRIIRDVWSLLTLVVSQKARALIHRFTYRRVAADQVKNVVVVGGSFAGWFAVDALSKSLPTGWRVVLVEANGHFNFTWLWPRMVGVPGHEHKAAVPYPAGAAAAGPPGAPPGIAVLKTGRRVVRIEADAVVLDGDDNERVAFDYLLLATGSSPRFPAGLTTSGGGVPAYFRGLQAQVRAADSIVVVGGGPVGVEIATDVKARWAGKRVALVHSRARLMNHFGPRLHDAGMRACRELGVRVHLGQRPDFPRGATTHEHGSLMLKSEGGDGDETIKYDLLINCTGQHIDSSLLRDLSPDSVSRADGGILVNAQLQVLKRPPTADAGEAVVYANILAAGDVTSLPATATAAADAPVPKMGRPAAMQGMHAARNIVRLINGLPLVPYRLNSLDRALKLTLGLRRALLYVFAADGRTELAVSVPALRVPRDPDDGLPIGDDLNVAHMWHMLGQKPYVDPGDRQPVT